MLSNKIVLVTGGTGSFGRSFVDYILLKYRPKKIIVFSRDELKQYEMSISKNFKVYSKYNKGILRYFIGDIRDYKRLNKAMEGVDIVIHCAALKQVTTAEYNPFEAVKTNVNGAQNVIDAALENNVDKVIALSTDKACAPINLYGATKLASDKLFIYANNHKGWRRTKFSVVRYGNVMGSRGSVIPYFLGKRKNKYIPITNKYMTRFSITLSESVEFVVKSLERMLGGELFVPKIPTYRILDIMKAISPRAIPKIIGIRPGEKLHEELININDARKTFELDGYFVITPDSNYTDWNHTKFASKNKKIKAVSPNFSYSSNNNEMILSVQELEKLIIDNVPGGKVLLDS